MAEGGEPASNGPPVSNVSKDDETKASNVRHRGARNFSSSVGSAGETHTVVERENCTVNEYHRYMMISKLRLQGGKHDEAVKYFKQALECGRQAKGIDDPDVLDAHLRLGELCLQYRYSQDALDALLRALEILERSDNPTRQRLWQCHDFLAQTYANFNEPQKEIEHYEKAIQCLSESTTPPPERLAQMHNNAGNAYEKLGKQALNDAMQHFQKAKDVMESLRLHESRNMIKVHLSLGNVYKALDKPELAIFELERSIKVSETTHPTEEKRRTKTRLTLIQLYNSTGNTAKAKEHEKKLQPVEAAGTSGYPQPLSVTMGGGEESLGNSRPQDLTGSDAPFTYISNSSNQTASFPSLKSDSSGGSNSLHRHPEGAVAASNQGAVEGAPPLERRPPSEDSIPPKDDTAPGNLSLSERQSTGMEVPQGHVPVAPIASEQHQLPIQILNNGSALLTTGFAHTVVEDITVEPPAPVTREFDDVAHEDIAPVNEGGPFHQVQEVIIDPPSENQSLSSELASNSLDGQPCTRGMTEQAVENQGPLSVNGIQQHGMPAQVNWTTARQEGEYEVPVPEELLVIQSIDADTSNLLKVAESTKLKQDKTSLLSTDKSLPIWFPTDRLSAGFPLHTVLGKLAIDEKSPLQPTPDYVELLSDIARVLTGYEDIVAPLYCPSPQNPQKLLIQGPGLAQAKDAIEKLRNQYPGYEIVVSDRQPVMTSKESNLPIYTHFLTNGNPKMPCYLHKNALTDDADFHVATIGVFLKDDSIDTAGLVFGATAAHALLTKGELQHLSEHGAPGWFKARTGAVTDDRAKRSHIKQVLSLAPHNCAPVQVQNPPFIAFTHMIPTPESNNPALQPFQRFAADIALLPVATIQLDGDASSNVTQRSISSLYSEYILMPGDIGKPSRRVPIGGYINITDSHDIAKLRDTNVKILVGGVTGAKLQIQPHTFTLATLLSAEAERTDGHDHSSIPQWMIAPHFAFTADSALPSGNSGAPVMVYNQEEDVLYIIGLLMGSFKGAYEWSTDVLYQAMPFGPALKQLMFLYDEHLTNLRPVIGEHTARSDANSDNRTQPDGKYEEDCANQLVKFLNKRGPMEGYHPVPDGIKQFISGVALEEEVECAAVYQCPLHPKELEIIGMHASSMSDVIKPSMSEFPGYSFTIHESSDPRHHVEFRGNDIFSVSKGVWQSGRDPETNRPCKVFDVADSCQCGLILEGSVVNRNTSKAYYVVVPAHLVLEREFNKLLLEVTNTKTMEEMRKEVQSTADKTEYTLHMHNSADTCDIQPMPFLAYRHFVPGDSLEPRFCQFTNDLAILKIETDQTRDEEQTGIIPLSTIVSAMQQKFGISSGGQPTEIDDIFPLQYPNTLVEMASLGVRVIIGAGQIKGHLVPCGDRLSNDGRTWSFAIEFITDGWQLKEGDCGLILYVQDKREGKRLYPFGMFIGKSLRMHCCNQTIYRAVVLRQALDEILSYYNHKVTSLRPIRRADNQETDGADWVPDLQKLNEEDLRSAACLQATNARSESGEFAGNSGVSVVNSTSGASGAFGASDASGVSRASSISQPTDSE